MSQGSIDHWRKLVRESLDFAAYEESRGSSGAAYRAKADTYERTARALEIEQETGVPVCVCCHKQKWGSSRK